VTSPATVSAQHQRLLHFVGNADWSGERMLAKVRELVLPAIVRHGPIEVWIVDDTSFPKQGSHSVGVHHQYCGQLGKQANCQVVVTLSIANHQASLPIAYRLYLPQAWIDDAHRREKARVPAAIKFNTKPQIALEQIRAAHAAGIPRGVVLLDASYGSNKALRDGITALGLTYAVAIVPSVKVRPVRPHAEQAARVSVKDLALSLPKQFVAHDHLAGRQQRAAALAFCPRARARCADPRRREMCRRDAAHRMAPRRGQADQILARNRR
jgi:SRSO17 transposase